MLAEAYGCMVCSEIQWEKREGWETIIWDHGDSATRSAMIYENYYHAKRVCMDIQLGTASHTRAKLEEHSRLISSLRLYLYILTKTSSVHPNSQ